MYKYDHIMLMIVQTAYRCLQKTMLMFEEETEICNTPLRVTNLNFML